MLGLLLVERIEATKAYTNYPGYDLIAFNAAENISCRIQVKSRWATDYDRSFPLKSFDAEVVAHVALNRGYRGYRKQPTLDDDGRRAPQVYVLPMDVARSVLRDSGKWGSKVYLREIPDVDEYVDNWGQVRRHAAPGPRP